MAIISQKPDRYKVVLGWYGQCAEENNGDIIDCQDLQLSVFTEYISSIYRWTDDGLLRSWKHNTPPQLNKFNSLECGRLYFMTIKPGTKSFSIPNFIVSTYESSNLGLLTNECALPEPTPTPIDCECAPTGFRELELNNIFIESDNMTLLGFPINSKLYYDETKVETSTFHKVSFRFPNGTSAGSIDFSGKRPKNSKFYLKYGNKCYSASALDTNVSGNGNWFLDLVHTDTLPSGCGEDVELPTPTPVPEQTPTPVDCSCAPSNFVNVSIKDQTDSVMLDDLVFANAGSHSFMGFQSDVVVSYDESTLLDEAFSTIKITYPGTTMSPTIQMSGKIPSSATKIYVKRGNECYMGTPVKSGTVYVCNMSLVETLSSDCGEKLDFPTPTPQPTPTPIISSTDCCPIETHSTVTTSGINTVKVENDTNGKPAFTYQGFSSGAKLCVNTSGNEYDDFATTRFVYHDSDLVNPIGTIKKFKRNDDNNIFYINTNTNECFHGEITNDTKIILSSIGETINVKCCDDSNQILEFENGNVSEGISVNQITLIASSNGEMDGKLCWPTLTGFAPPSSYSIFLSDRDQSEDTLYQIKVTTQIPVSDTIFNYEHKNGACYSGNLDNPTPGINIFNRIK